MPTDWVRGGFMPPQPIRDLRELTRRRKILIQERQREANRLHKALEDPGIKLGAVASDVHWRHHAFVTDRDGDRGGA